MNIKKEDNWNFILTAIFQHDRNLFFSIPYSIFLNYPPPFLSATEHHILHYIAEEGLHEWIDELIESITDPADKEAVIFNFCCLSDKPTREGETPFIIAVRRMEYKTAEWFYLKWLIDLPYQLQLCKSLPCKTIVESFCEAIEIMHVKKYQETGEDTGDLRC